MKPGAPNDMMAAGTVAVCMVAVRKHLVAALLARLERLTSSPFSLIALGTLRQSYPMAARLRPARTSIMARGCAYRHGKVGAGHACQ